MSTVQRLKEYVDNSIKLYPQHKEEIQDLFQLCLDEIEEGGSIWNECSLCENGINELIN